MMIKILVIILIILLVLLLAVSYYLARFVDKPVSGSMEEQITYEKAHNFWRDFDKQSVEEYIVKGYEDYELHTFFIPADEPSDYYVIISHGYTSSRYGALKYFNMYHEFGFNCIIYDDRAHGMNAPTVCTMGLKESRDLIAQINYTYEKFGHDIILGLQGESMGSALTITALKYKPDVAFVVADCGYYDLKSLLKYQINNMFHLPKWFIHTASLMSKICFGYAFSEVSPIQSLYDNEIPICFMHGGSDRLIPPHHAVKMYFANKGYKELHIIDDADHAVSIGVNEDEYKYHVNNFLMKVFDIKDDIEEIEGETV